MISLFDCSGGRRLLRLRFDLFLMPPADMEVTMKGCRLPELSDAVSGSSSDHSFTSSRIHSNVKIIEMVEAVVGLHLPVCIHCTVHNTTQNSHLKKTLFKSRLNRDEHNLTQLLLSN